MEEDSKPNYEKEIELNNWKATVSNRAYMQTLERIGNFSNLSNEELHLLGGKLVNYDYEAHFFTGSLYALRIQAGDPDIKLQEDIANHHSSMEGFSQALGMATSVGDYRALKKALEKINEGVYSDFEDEYDEDQVEEAFITEKIAKIKQGIKKIIEVTPDIGDPMPYIAPAFMDPEFNGDRD